MSRPFRFKQFEISQQQAAQKVGTDGVLIGAWARGGRRILDIGTGTGLIALMMAQRNPEARVVGIDIDPTAIAEARHNIQASPWADRVEARQVALADYHTEEPFDAIVSNPPYFPGALMPPDPARARARHADSLPLADLVSHARRLLSEEGSFSLILPSERRPEIEAEARKAGFYPWKALSVSPLPGGPVRRVLIEFGIGPVEGRPEEQHLVLEDGCHGRTAAYSRLMQDFYLDRQELKALKQQQTKQSE